MNNKYIDDWLGEIVAPIVIVGAILWLAAKLMYGVS